MKNRILHRLNTINGAYVITRIYDMKLTNIQIDEIKRVNSHHLGGGVYIIDVKGFMSREGPNSIIGVKISKALVTFTTMNKLAQFLND